MCDSGAAEICACVRAGVVAALPSCVVSCVPQDGPLCLLPPPPPPAAAPTASSLPPAGAPPAAAAAPLTIPLSLAPSAGPGCGGGDASSSAFFAGPTWSPSVVRNTGPPYAFRAEKLSTAASRCGAWRRRRGPLGRRAAAAGSKPSQRSARAAHSPPAPVDTGRAEDQGVRGKASRTVQFSVTISVRSSIARRALPEPAPARDSVARGRRSTTAHGPWWRRAATCTESAPASHRRRSARGTAAAPPPSSRCTGGGTSPAASGAR